MRPGEGKHVHLRRLAALPVLGVQRPRGLGVLADRRQRDGLVPALHGRRVAASAAPAVAAASDGDAE